MKKSMLRLLVLFIMLFYTLASDAIAQDVNLSAVCTNYNVYFAVSGANVDYAMATPDGDNGILDIIVSGVTEAMTITPTFTDNKVAVSGTAPEIITVDLSCGFAITEFEVVFQDSVIPAGRWTINVVDADFSEEESDKLTISTDLDELGVIYTQGMDALPLTVVAEYTGIAEEAVTYQWYSNTKKSTEGGMAIADATDASYTPSTDIPGTIYYYVIATCNELTAVSKLAEITVEASALPVAQNVIDISDRTLQSEADEYVKLTDIIIIGVKVEKATENDTVVNIVLDGNNPDDTEVSFEFVAERFSAEISGHTGTVKLNGGKATQVVTITAKSANISSWEESVTYTLNFSLGTPSERKAERIEITKQPTKTNYIEGEIFDPSGMEVTVHYSDGSSQETENFEYTPSGQLTEDDTTITVTYKGNEDDVSFVSTNITITVEKKQSGGGTVGGGGFYEEDEPQYNSIEVYITFVNRGEIVVQDEQVVVYDENKDGKYSIGDAFRALHREHYSGGESGYKEISGNGLSGWVSKFWGSSDSTFTYALNHSWAKSTQDSIRNGDKIAAINGLDDVFYSDLFTWFEKSSYSAKPDTDVELKVNGLNLMASNATYNALHAPYGATVTVYDQSGKEVKDMSTTVSKDGTFTLKFEQSGTYTVKVSGEATWGSYSDAPVAPSTCKVSVSSGGGAVGGGDKTDSEKDDKEIITTLKPEVTTNSSGEAKVVLNSEDVTNALTQVKKDNKDVLEIAPEVKGEASKVEINLPAESLNKIADSGLGINVNTPVADVKLSEKAVAELATQKGELSVTASSDKDGKISIDVSVDGKSADKIDGGLKVVLPDESKGKVMVIVNEDGSETIVTKHISSDGVHQAMLPGSATIKMIDNHKEFTDSKGHWGEGSINFVTERELYQGVGNGKFDTEGTMTRAMLVTVLYRLEGETKANYEHNFTDVTDSQWYADSVAWANENNIVKGVDDNSFDPDAFVTREQVATILYRYAQYLDMSTHHKGDITQFNDHHEVSDWAKDAKSWAVGAGIIGGKPGNILDSNGNATRTEVAAIIERLITIMVK